ncbi:hypothetical protein OGAPHI_000324 [Ogataea philodendri]|uniref:Uncharacterized protein n=1 Tax=Ogataea philodendri TaxID=1378263 RepID=A0A9P8PGR1_9ASCO|nr:uncharacterized protein OGAPHI_000324 [Ogataea philodendri]KAH3671621.1 hypothetical protein OGAPHI_000324 [Ogataea philodendri]
MQLNSQSGFTTFTFGSIDFARRTLNVPGFLQMTCVTDLPSSVLSSPSPSSIMRSTGEYPASGSGMLIFSSVCFGWSSLFTDSAGLSGLSGLAGLSELSGLSEPSSSSVLMAFSSSGAPASLRAFKLLIWSSSLFTDRLRLDGPRSVLWRGRKLELMSPMPTKKSYGITLIKLGDQFQTSPLSSITTTIDVSTGNSRCRDFCVKDPLSSRESIRSPK